MTLALTHDKTTHLIFEVNQDVELSCTQEECPYWNEYQKDCNSDYTLELDYPKLVKLLEDKGLKPRASK